MAITQYYQWQSHWIGWLTPKEKLQKVQISKFVLTNTNLYDMV